MEKITYSDNIVYKKYPDFETTKREYQSMNFIYNSYHKITIGGVILRSLKIIGYDKNRGYHMERIWGKTAGEIFWTNSNSKIFYYIGAWFGNYINRFNNNHVINNLDDMTTHNFMLSNKNELILLDQTNAYHQTSTSEKMISYLIARHYFEQTLHLVFNFKFYREFFLGYNKSHKKGFNCDLLNQEILNSYKRISRKLKYFNYFKRQILRMMVWFYYLNLKIYLKFRCHENL